jgi:hypothetical protein
MAKIIIKRKKGGASDLGNPFIKGAPTLIKGYLVKIAKILIQN